MDFLGTISNHALKSPCALKISLPLAVTSVKLTEPKQPAHIKPILNDCATFVLVCALLFDDCA